MRNKMARDFCVECINQVLSDGTNSYIENPAIKFTEMAKNGDFDPLSEEEYTALLENRGREKLAENQLVKSFSAVIRTIDPTYTLGEDFHLGDTITVIDERMGVTADAVVQGVERAVGEDGESMVLTLGYSQPTIYDVLRKAGR